MHVGTILLAWVAIFLIVIIAMMGSGMLAIEIDFGSKDDEEEKGEKTGN